MDERVRKILVLYYLQRKRRQLASRRNLLKILEVKLKNEQRLITSYLSILLLNVKKIIRASATLQVLLLKIIGRVPVVDNQEMFSTMLVYKQEI